MNLEIGLFEGFKVLKLRICLICNEVVWLWLVWLDEVWIVGWVDGDGVVGWRLVG